MKNITEARIEARVRDLIAKAEGLYPNADWYKNYTIGFNMRSVNTAGKVDWSKNRRSGECTYFRISYNPKFYCNMNISEYDNTIIHEVAHYVEFCLYGTTGHTYRFTDVFKALGGDGKTGHTYHKTNEVIATLSAEARQKKQAKKIELLCPSCGRKYFVGQRKYNNMLRRGFGTSFDTYHCRCSKNSRLLVKDSDTPANYNRAPQVLKVTYA